MMVRIQALPVIVLAMAGLVGCVRVCPTQPPPPALYNGQLEDMQAVVNAVSVQALPLRTLWARHDFSISVRDEKGNVRSLDGDGALLLRKPPLGSPVGTPTEMRLTGSKDVIGPVFDVGANRQRAWMTLQGDFDTMYWLNQGSEVDPRQMPARPDLIADVLGLADVSTDLASPPAPVMRYDSAQDCYVLLFVQQPEGESYLITRRELWVDRSTKRIRQVLLFSPDGRVAVQSKLSDWKPVMGTNAQAPGNIELYFPLSQSSMRFVLGDVMPSYRGRPNDASFAFPENPPVSKTVQLDAPPAR